MWPKLSSIDRETPPPGLCWGSSEKELVQLAEAKFGRLLRARLTKQVFGLLFFRENEAASGFQAKK